MTNLMTNFQTTIDVNLLKSADRNLLSNINYAPNGLYNPAEEHDSCGIGMAVDIKEQKSHDIVRDGIVIVIRHVLP
jgi:hypothetical protein